MQDVVKKLLEQMKAIKIPASKIEKDLNFSNGQLGQVAKGKSKLSEERLNSFSQYCWLKLTDGKETGSMNVTTGEMRVNSPDPENKNKQAKIIEEAKKKNPFEGIVITPEDKLPSKTEALKKFTADRVK